MENLKLLTDNTSLNPYVRRSYSMKVNTELLTANKSVIRAINEVAQNQKAILNSILLLYKKLNITIGDIAENKELKNAYNALEFANVMDGLVKLSLRIDNLSITQVNTEIRELKNTISNDFDNVNDIFTTMNWNDVMDALIKINKRISDYIVEDTESAANEYTVIRDDISNLMSIIGYNDENDRNNLVSNYENIIKTILNINSYLAINENSLQTLNNMGYVSASHAINTIHDKVNSNTQSISELRNAQTQNVNSLAAMNSTITDLSNDLQRLMDSSSETSSSELDNIGYSSVIDGLQKLTEAVNEIIAVIGDINSNEEYVTAYKSNEFENMIDAIVSIQKMITTLAGNSLNTSMLNITNKGYENIIDAITDIITKLGISEQNLTRMEANNYSSIINAILTLTEQINSINSSLNSSGSNLEAHNASLEAHPDAISGYFRHKTNHQYEEGEIVFIPELPNNMCLVCIAPGTTDTFRPDFKSM